MIIESVRFTVETNDQVEITFGDDSTYTQPYNEVRYRYTDQLNEWLALGNIITSYDQYYGRTIEQAQTDKSQECDGYGQSLIDAAHTNPQIGVNVHAGANKRRTDSRRNDKADKQAGEIELDQAEKDQAKSDQKLSEYEGKIWKDSDKAITNMLKLSTATEIYEFVVPAQSWNVWTPQ